MPCHCTDVVQGQAAHQHQHQHQHQQQQNRAGPRPTATGTAIATAMIIVASVIRTATVTALEHQYQYQQQEQYQYNVCPTISNIFAMAPRANIFRSTPRVAVNLECIRNQLAIAECCYRSQLVVTMSGTPPHAADNCCLLLTI